MRHDAKAPGCFFAKKSFWLPSLNVSNCRRLLELEEELREISGDAVTGEFRGRQEQHTRIITLAGVLPGSLSPKFF